MKKKTKGAYCIAAALLAAFALWTVAVMRIDVRAIGPQESSVGLAAMNRAVHELTGVHLSLYILTDWLSLIPAGFVLGFAALGLCQWIRRKSILKVDASILVLGGFYLVVLALYAFFELAAVNFRPVLIEGRLEVSYPSSTTLLVLCVMPTAMLQLARRIKGRTLRRWSMAAMAAYTLLMLLCRLVSGVHWFSDIVGGCLLSAGLVVLYQAVCSEE